MKLKRVIVAGAIALVLGLVVMFPARAIYHWFAPDYVRISGISGSIWNGHAAEGVAAGVYFRNIDWRFKPLSLVTGRVAFDTGLELGSGFAEAEVGVGFTGRVFLNDFNASLPLAAFDRALLLNGTTGELTLQVPRAELDAGWPTALAGTIGVANLTIPNFSSTPVGSYRAEFRTTDEAIVGSVEDTGGILDLAGTVRLTPDRAYSFIGQVAATAGAPESVTRQLRFLGSADERGLREFRFEGTF